MALARLIYEHRRQPGEVSFSPDDWGLMQELLPDDPYIWRVTRVQVLKVRRHRLLGRWEAFELRAFEGERVVVVWIGYEWECWAVVWRFNEYTRELAQHGREGLICVIEPLAPPQSVDWDQLERQGLVSRLSYDERFAKRIFSRS